MKNLDFVDGGDPITSANLTRAINRMSYDYQKMEKKLVKFHSVMHTIESNMSKFKMGALVPIKPLGETVQKLNQDDRDFKSRISKFCLLKTLLSTSDLVHLNEIELAHWHIINTKLMDVGLWSQFKFIHKEDTEKMIDMLMITALKAKKICNSEAEYSVYQEFVFHNTTLAYIYADIEKNHHLKTCKDKRNNKE